MNKNFATILTTATLALAAGCVTAGTWVNGCYIDGPLCTVCDGTKVVTHAYGTTVCTHCDGTGIEPPEETVVMNTLVCDTWCPSPVFVGGPPHNRHHRPIAHRNPPAHRANPPPRHAARPANRPANRPAARPANRPAARPAPRRTGGGGTRGGHRHR